MKPSPDDVLRALSRIDPEGWRVLDRTGSPSVAMKRRAAMAACRALGWNLVRIGKTFHRDHTTVIGNLKVYVRNRNLGGYEAEADLFRKLIVEAHEIAAERAAKVTRLSDYRGRAA